MKKLAIYIILILGVFLLACSNFCTNTERTEISVYKANYSSIQKHHIPQWLLDAKFGIYCHWGAQTALYENGLQRSEHIKGLELWKGKKFLAKEWTALFKKAGAQFAGPVAWHMNGCLNWDSEITNWNSTQKGPGIDIVGELEKEIRKTDMKFMVSIHSNTLWGPISTTDTTYINADKMYNRQGKRVHPKVFGKENRFSASYTNGLLERLIELTDKYQPDLMWFDFFLGGTMESRKFGYMEDGQWIGSDKELFLDGLPESVKLDYISHYYNMGLKNNREVEFTYKVHDVAPMVGMRDIENGLLDNLQYDPWMTDLDLQIHSQQRKTWFYNPELEIMSANMLTDILIDVTSKNGRVLLNVPPKSDGTFAQPIKEQLFKMGTWLGLNGEAIYGTTPWCIYGEGPTKIKHPGHYGQKENLGKDIPRFKSKDIRYTQKDQYLYAICLDWPTETIKMKALGYAGIMFPGDIKSITLLGSDEVIKWEHKQEALEITAPTKKPCKFAYVFKIER